MGLLLPVRSNEEEFIWRSFEQHSRTFSLAARFLPAPMRSDVATLYLFCRQADQIADVRLPIVGVRQALHELGTYQHELDHALVGKPPKGILWSRLSLIVEKHRLEPGPFYELLEGVRWDIEGRPIETEEDLLLYSDLVAGSVGAMMLPFLAEYRFSMKRYEPAARALGQAMQITNILRDVGEDLFRLGRIYIPQELLERVGIDPDHLSDAVPTDRYVEVVEHLMHRAEHLYDLGLAGITGLRTSVRPTILGAGRMYREILNAVRSNRYDNFRRRAYIPLHRKLGLILQDGYRERRDQLRHAHRQIAEFDVHLM